nr:hydroquinone glucosyltransferase-like [Ipomoea batatas]
MAETQTQQTPHVVIVPTPGMGHLIPLAEFAKRLVLQHQFSVTFVLPTDGPISTAQKTVLENLPAGTHYTCLPPVSFDDLAEDVKIETRISLQITRSLPAFRDEFKSLVAKTKTVALVVDLFGTDAFDVAIEFKVSPYIFFPSTGMCLSLFLHMSELDQKVSGEYRDMTEPVQIPGCVPIQGKDLLAPVQDRTDEAYKWVLHHTKRYRMAEGIVANTFMELEPGAVKYLQESEPGKPTVYPVGPLIKMEGSGTGKLNGTTPCPILEWLDQQPGGSVLYISFGSGGTHTHKQLIEIASGLEKSEQRFIWVVRCPNDLISNATYFSVQSSSNPLDFMPPGFMDRTKGLGLVVPDWAPQTQILSHESVGGFLTHCGWNSILESVVHGVPLIAWPMYAEQRMNAVIVTEDIKVALRPKAGEDGLVGELEIAEAAKALIQGEEGKEVRKRMKDLKDAAHRVLSPDGSSTKALDDLASKLKAKIA